MKWLSKIAACACIDGLLHVIVSAIIVLVVQIFAPWWVAMLVAMLIGIAKELIWDFYHQKGQMQIKDIICDIIGILIGCLAFL